MAKLWQGVTSGETAAVADDFNSSIGFDSRMYREDITGSMAHARMLAKQGIIEQADCDALLSGLASILADLDSGALSIDPSAEDIHMFVEEVLTARLGDVGKKLHTARSRNDQVALDLRLYLRRETLDIESLLKRLISALTDKAEENRETIMPGYTHLQRAQPISFGQHLMAYAMMLRRDVLRLRDLRVRMDAECPIGSCALAGTTYDTDRSFEAGLLGFSGVGANSLDGVSDRDFCLELAAALSITMMHLSRLSEELILWSSWEFRFIRLSDDFTTGSSIMPQKKNPDMAELCRGKTGRVYGDMMALFTTMKGLPLAYNKDMQEDKEQIFDSCDSVRACLEVYIPMIASMTVLGDNMLRAAGEGFINATDLADYLVRKGLPFRSAYKVSGSLVARSMELGLTLEALPLEIYKEYSPLIDEDVYAAVDLRVCMEKRCSQGGTSVASVTEQIGFIRDFLND